MNDCTPLRDNQSNLLDCRSVYRRLFDTEAKPPAPSAHLLFDAAEDMHAVSISSQSRDSLEDSPAALPLELAAYRCARRELTARRQALEQRLQSLRGQL